MASMREMRDTMGVPAFRQATNGHAPADDELAQAIRQRRSLLGARLLDDTATQVQAAALLDARKLELEARKLELEEAQTEAKLEALRADLRAAKGQQQSQGDGILGAVVQLLMDDREAQREAAKDQAEAQRAMYEKMLDFARQPPAAPPPPPTLPTLAERVGEVKAVMEVVEALRPQQLQAPSALTAQELISLERMRAEIEAARELRAAQFQLQLREMQGKEGTDAKRLAIQEAAAASEIQRNDRMAGLLEQLGPAAVGALAQRLAPEEAEQPPPGIQIKCPNPACGKDLNVPAGMTSGQCRYCRQVIVLEQEQQPG